MTVRLSSSPGYRPGEQEQIAEWIRIHGKPRRYECGEQPEKQKRRHRMSKKRQVLAALKSHAVRAAGRAAE